MESYEGRGLENRKLKTEGARGDKARGDMKQLIILNEVVSTEKLNFDSLIPQTKSLKPDLVQTFHPYPEYCPRTARQSRGVSVLRQGRENTVCW